MTLSVELPFSKFQNGIQFQNIPKHSKTKLAPPSLHDRPLLAAMKRVIALGGFFGMLSGIGGPFLVSFLAAFAFPESRWDSMGFPRCHFDYAHSCDFHPVPAISCLPPSLWAWPQLGISCILLTSETPAPAPRCHVVSMQVTLS